MTPPIIGETLRVWFLSALVVHGAVAGNPDAKRLYDDLLSNYNKLVRPVVNTSDVLRVCIKLKLSQLIDVVSVTRMRRNVIFNDAITIIDDDEMSGISSGFRTNCIVTTRARLRSVFRCVYLIHTRGMTISRRSRLSVATEDAR